MVALRLILFFVVVNPSPPTPFITSNRVGYYVKDNCIHWSFPLCSGTSCVLYLEYCANGATVLKWLAPVIILWQRPINLVVHHHPMWSVHPLPDLSCIPSGCYEFCNDVTQSTIPSTGFCKQYLANVGGRNLDVLQCISKPDCCSTGGKYRLPLPTDGDVRIQMTHWILILKIVVLLGYIEL